MWGAGEKMFQRLEEEKSDRYIMFLACRLAWLKETRAKQKTWWFRPNHRQPSTWQEAGNSLCPDREPLKFLSRETTRPNISLRQVILAAIGKKKKRLKNWDIRKRSSRNLLQWSGWSLNQSILGKGKSFEEARINRIW